MRHTERLAKRCQEIGSSTDAESTASCHVLQVKWKRILLTFVLKGVICLILTTQTFCGFETSNLNVICVTATQMAVSFFIAVYMILIQARSLLSFAQSISDTSFAKAYRGRVSQWLNAPLDCQKGGLNINIPLLIQSNVEQASLQASAAIMCICKAYPTALQSGNSNTGRNSLQRMSREGNINSIDRICSSLAIACGRVQSMPNAANAAGEAVMNFSIFNQLKSVIMNDFGIHFIFIFLTMCCTLTLCHFSIQSFLW